MVFASVGVIAGCTVCTEFTPIDRAIPRWTLRIDRGRQRRIADAISGIEEERHAEPLLVSIRQDPVQWRLVSVIRPDLHDVTDVDDERVGNRLNQRPRAFAKDFEARLLILQQQCERPCVRVMVDAEVAVLCHREIRWPHGSRTPWVIIQTQKTGMRRSKTSIESSL